MLSLNLNKNLSIEWGANFFKVSGPLGILVKRKDDFSLAMKDSKLYLWSKTTPEKEATYLSLLKSVILGVTKGYKQKLRLIGVGYRATILENTLQLKIGYSHEVNYKIPANITITPSKAKGILLLIKGQELQKVKQVAVEIRMLRKPDSYKGKGIHYDKEVLVLKKGKREGK